VTSRSLLHGVLLDGWRTLVSVKAITIRAALASVVVVGLLPLCLMAAQTAAPDSKAVPVIDGGLGPCSADFTVTDSAGAPVYDAKIRVHIAYRFMSLHKLDLEIGTNADGKARVTGLPDRIKHGIYFHTSQGDRTAETFDDPANTCKAQFTVVLGNAPEKKAQ
jgi:hypothetical protein